MAGPYWHDTLCACEPCRWEREQDADDRAIARAEDPDIDHDTDKEPPC